MHSIYANGRIQAFRQDIIHAQNEIKAFIQRISEYTGQNTIYYTANIAQAERKEFPSKLTAIDAEDIQRFEEAIQNQDPAKNLLLILHTLGGDPSSMKTIAKALQNKFPAIHALIPEIAMSGGTVLAFVGNLIMMGKEAALGSTELQIHIKNGAESATKIIKKEPSSMESIRQRTLSEIATQAVMPESTIPAIMPGYKSYVDQRIKGEIQEIKERFERGEATQKELLRRNMFKGERASNERIEGIIRNLRDDRSGGHKNRISRERAKSIGLKIKNLEDDPTLENLVAILHHNGTTLLKEIPAAKLIASNNGKMRIIDPLPHIGRS